jgi:hypothetical protein
MKDDNLDILHFLRKNHFYNHKVEDFNFYFLNKLYTKIVNHSLGIFYHRYFLKNKKKKKDNIIKILNNF